MGARATAATPTEADPRPLTDRVRGLPAAAALLAAVAAATVVRSSSGRYVGDNRFDQYWAPGWRLLRELSLWDSSRGMGRVGEELWPLTLPLALLRGLGLSPIAAQQLWHVIVLTLAGLGVVVLLRTFQATVGATHVVAALAYVLSPYAATFLLPTNLFWSFVLTPWLLAVALQGLRGARPWRCAGVWALLVASGGDTDLPGLALSALWVVPLTAYCVLVERSCSWRRALGWLAGAVGLAAWVDAAVLVKVRLGSAPLAQRLLTTEGVAQVNLTSSWSESWRGLGYWLSYFGTGDDLGGRTWYETVPGVLLTFVVPTVALVAAWRSRWRLRLLWTGMAVVAVAIMVGSNPVPTRSPLGQALLGAYDAAPSLASFRTTYKAGSGLVVAVAVLAATGASAWGATLARRHPRLRSLPLTALATAVVATAVPVWSGHLYNEDDQTSGIAPHWVEAARWIERQPGDARVLVLPGSTQTAYRWGWVGDDILDSLLRRHPNVVPTNFPVSTPLTADIIDAVGRRLEEGRLDAGELRAVARRLGVGWVLLRNDLDWQRLRVPRPEALAALRNSADLPLARTFGTPGTDTTDGDDDSAVAGREAELAPIEVLRVPGVDGRQRLARSDATPLVVDGGGDAWPVLARLGLLDGDRALRFAGQADDAELQAALERGAPLVVTDTNRRRLTLIRGPGPTSSEVLSPTADPGPVAPADLFGRKGTQTVASYGEAAEIEATGGGDEDLGGLAPWYRPANAFDGDLATSWRTGGQRDPRDDLIRVTFTAPQPMASIVLTPLRSDAGLRRVTEVDVDTGAGPQRVAVRAGGPTRVALRRPVTARHLEVRIVAVGGRGDGPVGFSEISVGDVDTGERLDLPDHVTATQDTGLRRAAVAAPRAYVLTRSTRALELDGVRIDEERTLRRRFALEGPRTLLVHGEVAGGRDLPDRAVDALLGGPVGAWGSSRPAPPSEGRGGLAVDGDPGTGWVGTAARGERLTVRFPIQPVTAVRVRLGAGPDDVPLDHLFLTAGRSPARSRLELAPEPECSEPPCDLVGEVTVPLGAVGQVALTVDADVPGGRRVRILEVEVLGPSAAPRAGPVAPGAGSPGDGAPDAANDECGQGPLRIDDTEVAVRLDADAGDDVDRLLDAPTVDFVGCRPVALEPGTHEVTSGAPARLDVVVLATTGALDTPEATPVEGRAETRGPAQMDVRLTGEAPAVVVTGQSYDAGWRAELDGRDLGAPFEADGQSAWRVPAGADRRVRLTFAPQRTYRAALIMSLLGAVTCGALIVASPRRPRRRVDHR